LDNSGLRNHALNLVRAGLSFNGSGASGLFSNGDYLEVPHTKAFETEDFSITFWLFFIQDYFTENKGIRYCPIIQKGKDDLFSKTYNRFPSIYLDRKNRALKTYIKTQNKAANLELNEGASFISNSKIKQQKWMHISLVKKEKILTLYVNGIKDNSLKLIDGEQNNKDNLYIGGTPWLKDQCNFPYLMDEVRYYNKAITEDSIQSEASPALGGIETNFVNLGCLDCSLQEASSACKKGYKICSTIELHTAGYQIARSLGWIDWSTHIWTNSALNSPTSFNGFKGLGICCKEQK
jgi:hypothetical protein